MQDPLDSGGGTPAPLPDDSITISKSEFEKYKNQIVSDVTNSLDVKNAEKWEKTLCDNDMTWQIKIQSLNIEHDLQLKVMNDKLNHLTKLLDTLQKQQNTNKHSNLNSDCDMDFDDDNSSTTSQKSTSSKRSKRANRKHKRNTSNTDDLTYVNDNTSPPAKRSATVNSSNKEWPSLPSSSIIPDPNHSNTVKINLPQNSNHSQESTVSDVAKEGVAKKLHVPPIIIRDKKSYNNISNAIKHYKLNVNKITNTFEGIKLHPDTPRDYNKLIKILDTEKVPYHSFRFASEKELHIVIRGVLEEWSETKIKDDLIDLGFNPSRVIRWKRRDGTPMPLVLVFLPKSEKHIFDLNKLDTLDVKIETQRSQQNISQCHRCQLFGHSQFRCTAPLKCLKCAQSHFSSDCKLDKLKDKPMCANCGGEHVSNDRECPKHPYNYSKRFDNFNNDTEDDRQRYFGEKSYAQAANKPNKNLSSSQNNNFPSQPLPSTQTISELSQNTQQPSFSQLSAHTELNFKDFEKSLQKMVSDTSTEFINIVQKRFENMLSKFCSDNQINVKH